MSMDEDDWTVVDVDIPTSASVNDTSKIIDVSIPVPVVTAEKNKEDVSSDQEATQTAPTRALLTPPPEPEPVSEKTPEATMLEASPTAVLPTTPKFQQLSKPRALPSAFSSPFSPVSAPHSS
jgi:hypothetical protein